MRQTEKYVAAVDTATQYRVTRARTHAGLYNALEAAGFRWDSIDRRWLNTRGPASAGWGGPVKYGARWPQTGPGKPSRPGKPALESTQGRLPSLDVPAAQAAADRLRVDELTALVGRLSAQVEALDRSLRLLQSVPEISRFLAGTFGLDLVAPPGLGFGTLPRDD